MGADKNVFLCAGTNPSEAEARLDYEVFRGLHAEGDAAAFADSIAGAAND